MYPRWRFDFTPDASDPDSSPISPAEVFPERTIDEIADSTRPEGVEVEAWRDENLEAITQLSIPPETSRPSLWLTVVSLALFVVTLGRWLGWEQTPFIVAIVLIHEAGHLVLKKAFGYTDLQLFFIPFIGAAVSGRKDDASQVERALVAGGYLIAYHYGAFGMQDLPVRIALVALIINGFNLIPLGMLDGGQFFNAILFSRRPWMDTACKLLAVAALVYFGVGSPWISFGIAAFILLTLRTTHNIAVLSSKLRAAGLNQDHSLDEMPLERLMLAYAKTRDLVEDSSATTLERRVALRTGLLQRAYPGALARPASAAWVVLLLAIYFSVSGLGGYAWWIHSKAVKAAEEQRLAAPEDEDPDDHPLKFMN